MSNGGQSLGDPMMVGLFRSEVETHAATLNSGLLALEKNPKETKEIASLMRAAHSVKGAARIVNIDIAVGLAHAMEDVFVAVQNGAVVLDSDKVDVLLAGADLLARIGQLASDETMGQLMALSDSAKGLAETLGTVKTGLFASKPALASPGPPPAETGKAAPAEQKKPEKESPAAPAKDLHKDSVRVSTQHLNNLMNLAAESMVRGRSLESFSESLGRLRKELSFVKESLNDVHQMMVLTDDRNRERLDALCHDAQAFEQKLAACTASFGEFAFGFEALLNRIHQEAVDSRMRPFADGVVGFPRMVRDIAKSLGKKVHFEILGNDTSVDRDILEQLEPPITHLLRNALDHGIEAPETRKAANKEEEGHLVLQAQHQQGMLSITVSEDGRGIDVERIRLKIVAAGLTDPATALKLSRDEILQFLFLPGFSTASTVTEISGRGVGLDVVQNMVQKVGGAVRITTVKGEGTTMQMRLPITLSVVRTLLFEVNDEAYAFCLSHVDRCLHAARGEIIRKGNGEFIVVGGHEVPVFGARQVLSLPGDAPDSPNLPVILVGEDADRTGLAVDRCVGARSLAVRPMDPRLGPTPCVAAAAIMEDGSPVLILDVKDVVQWARKVQTAKSSPGAARRGVEKPKKRILVVEDSVTVREMERKLFESNGYAVDVAVDGMDGWNALTTGNYDLVVSDVDMPRMNGLALVSKIRGDARYGKLPIVIVSYKDRKEDRDLGLQAGADYYMTKDSFHDETILRTVKRVLKEEGPDRSTRDA